jgi:hypothetical protein
MNASKSENSAVNQETFQPVVERLKVKWEENSKKKCCIEYPVTVIIYCQTDRWFKIFDNLE